MLSQRTLIQSSIRAAFSMQAPRSLGLRSDHTLFCASTNLDQSPGLPTQINKCAMSFMRFIHFQGPKEFENERTNRSMNFVGGPNELEIERTNRSMDFTGGPNQFETERTNRSMNFLGPREFGPERTNRSMDFTGGPNQFDTERTNRPMNFAGPREFGPERTNRSMNFMGSREFGPEMTNRSVNFPRATEFGPGMTNDSMNFVSRIVNENRRDPYFGGQDSSPTVEQNADIVHIKLIRNNTFITLTDSKGNKKAGASSGCLAGGGKVSRYAAEATAEHVGRVARSMGIKSVVVKVNGFTLFKKKKQAILGFREGYTHSRGDQNPVVYIEDTTRKPHNGCRLRKKRRV